MRVFWICPSFECHGCSRFLECHGAHVDGAEQWTLAVVCFTEMGMITPTFGPRRKGRLPHDSDRLLRTTSAVTILVCGSRRLGSLRRRLAEERESFSLARGEKARREKSTSQPAMASVAIGVVGDALD
ncbi:hypothetical protein VIGAN_04383500 [Vigna angularis var. angularis]|uniref:Uncharacterized protein n=1 Tax=Vigna angularis var. angularis TaxID=157739 RepID=A0A0S3S0A8_PHAAN|nr:hypothetical protein VIGAN_04383500 [Vigna angularis var. angularis]